MDGFQLKQWVESNNIIKKTIDGFWICFDNYIDKDRKEFEEFFGKYDKNKLKLWFKEVRLTVRNWDQLDKIFWEMNDNEYNSNNEFIDAWIIIGYGEEESIGEYTMRFDKYGESFDDFFGMDWKDWAIIRQKYVENEVNIKFIKTALINRIDIELISKVTELSKKEIIDIKKKFKI